MVNKALNKTVGFIRQKNLKKRRVRNKTAQWRENDHLGHEVVDTGVIILPTRGCSWGRASGCTMCGYVYESGDIGDEQLLNAFNDALRTLGEIQYLKIFTSGSFFDGREVSEKLSASIIDSINLNGVKQVQIESRPEFIKKEALTFMKERLESQLEIGIGLETSNDLLRENCINKGFSFRDYEEAVALCRSHDALVKTYLLFKPPFILEREAIEDSVKSSLDAIKAGTDKISINPMNIQKGTLVEQLWRRGEYQTPWLWSLMEAIKELGKVNLSTPVLSHPTGGGSKRGVHNCGKCDSEILSAIKEFSLTQDHSLFDNLECGCKEHWQDYLLLE